MKGGGGGALRFESQRFRLLAIVVGCFLISVTFLLSSRPEATVFDSLSSKAWLQETRGPTIKTVRPSTGGLGRDFLVDILPQQGGSVQRTGDDRSSEKTDTEWVKDTVIIQERTDGESAEKEEAELGRNAAAGTGHSGDEAAPGDKEEAVQHGAVQTTVAAAVTAQPAVETTSTATVPSHPEEKKENVGGQIKLQADPARTEQTPERVDTAHSAKQPLPPMCDFSDFRSNICDFAGDIRMDANTSSFVLVSPAAVGPNAQSHKVRPYPRKGDETCMSRVTEIAVRTAAATSDAPRCTQTHSAPAVAFSIGGYTGNIFHDFSDVLVPLFNTAHRHGGDVHLVMANVASWWLVKYANLLRELSRHAPLDLAAAGAAREVHCFPRAAVGLRAHRELVIERARSRDGLATPDFTRFLRRALALPRDAPTRVADGSGRRPRLLIISRSRTRKVLNQDAVVRAAEEAGFEAVVNESDVGDDIARIGALINSCDVLMGVHGAGLTNMMFLPPGATMVQLVPWGGLQWVARMDYGEPAEAMGLRYIQYEIAVDESTLKDKYPRDHLIFTNPTALHKKGFGFMRETLMDGQDITVDVDRFKPVLLQALSNYLAQ